MERKSRFATGAHEHAARFLRENIQKGRWHPGQVLEATALAAELGISPSPVREAFARLHGERLLDTRHRGGYFIPLLQQHELESEYRFLRVLASSLAYRLVTPKEIHPPRPAHAYPDRMTDLLTQLGARADMPAAAFALQRSALRIGPYMRAEPNLVRAAEEHLADMERLLEEEDSSALSAAIESHFGNCMAATPGLARHVFEDAKRSGKDVE